MMTQDTPEPYLEFSIHESPVRFYLNSDGYIVKHNHMDAPSPIRMSANYFALGWNKSLQFGSPANGVSSRLALAEAGYTELRDAVRDYFKHVYIYGDDGQFQIHSAWTDEAQRKMFDLVQLTMDEVAILIAPSDRAAQERGG